MSYSIKIYPDLTGTGFPNVITDANIVSIDIDPNRAGNDNPFEIVGRTATVNSLYIGIIQYYVESLSELDIPLTTGSDPVINRDFFSSLVQIIDNQTSAPVFTGLIKRDSLEIDIKTDSLSFTICDSLYIYITFAKALPNRLYIDYISDTNISDYLPIPISAVPSPLSNCSFDLSKIQDTYANFQIKFPEYERPASSWYYYDVWDNQNEYSVLTDWSRCSQDANLWVESIGATSLLHVSFFVTFKNRYAVRSTDVLTKYYIATYDTTNLLQPVSYDTGVIPAKRATDAECFQYLAWKLIEKKVFPAGTIATPVLKTSYYGEFFEIEELTTAPSFNPTDLNYVIGLESITLNQPFYGQATANVNLTQQLMVFNRDFPGNLSTPVAAVMTYWMLNAKAKKGGGLDFYPSVFRNLNDPITITINDSDIVELKSKGSFLDAAIVESLDTFENPESVKYILSEYFKQFYDSLSTVYTVTIIKSNIASTFKPFAKITAFGKSGYLLKWTEPIEDDVITIEFIGSR